MDISGEYQIPANRELVWDLLNDPEILEQCIPGCEELTAIDEDHMAAKVTMRIGPVKAKFAGEVTLSEKDFPNSYRIDGEGKGGIAGFANGGALVNLQENSEGTLLSYQVDVNIGGKLAQLGSRLIVSTSNKLANSFFKTFSEIAAQKAAETA